MGQKAVDRCRVTAGQLARDGPVIDVQTAFRRLVIALFRHRQRHDPRLWIGQRRDHRLRLFGGNDQLRDRTDQAG